MPTSFSPSEPNATTEGVVLAPSAFSITCKKGQGMATETFLIAQDHERIKVAFYVKHPNNPQKSLFPGSLDSP